MTIILLIVGIANLAMLLHVAWTLKRIGKELNYFERWKGVSPHRYL